MIDLHTHTTASDGTYTPTELIRYAVEKGLNAVAITDHDTVAGVEEAMAEAEKCGIKLIPGIELSSLYNSEHGSKEIHVLGYNIDIKNKELVEAAEKFLNLRNERNQKMCGRLQQAGIDISVERLCERYGEAVITRANIARYLLEHGYVKTKDEAFDTYLSKNSPYYVKKEKINIEEAVRLINGAGGVAVIAHPVLYNMTEAELKELFTYAKEIGIKGVEAIYSNNASEDTALYKKLAAETGLFITGGSDFHGANKRIDLGVGYDNLYVPDDLLKNIGEE